MTFMQSAVLAIFFAFLAGVFFLIYAFVSVRRGRAAWLYIIPFTLALVLSGYFAYQRIEPRNLVQTYMSIVLPEDTLLERYHLDWLSRNPSYFIQIREDKETQVQIVAFFGDERNRMGKAIDRVPKSWNLPQHNPSVESYVRRRNSVVLEVDVDEDNGTIWLSIQTT